jgi:hypothetical protein
MLAVKRDRLRVRVERGRRVRVGRPGVRRIVHVHVRPGHAIEPGLEPARPFPEVAEAHHRGHPAPRDLRHRVVEARVERLVARAVGPREPRPDRIPQGAFLGRGHDPQVVDPESLEPVELAGEPRAVAVVRVGAEPCRIPHVRAHHAVGFGPVPHQPRALAGDEAVGRRGFGERTAAASRREEGEAAGQPGERRAPVGCHCSIGSSKPGTGIGRASNTLTTGASAQA